METFSWQAQEYHHEEKTTDWYWTVGIITAALVIVAIIFGNALFGIVLAIGAFSLVMFTVRKPGMIHVTVDNVGVRVDKMLYPYSSLESFSLELEHVHGEHLHLKSKKMIMPLITIPVALDDIDGLRILLAKHLKEEHYEPNILQSVFDRIGF